MKFKQQFYCIWFVNRDHSQYEYLQQNKRNNTALKTRFYEKLNKDYFSLNSTTGNHVPSVQLCNPRTGRHCFQWITEKGYINVERRAAFYTVFKSNGFSIVTTIVLKKVMWATPLTAPGMNCLGAFNHPLKRALKLILIDSVSPSRSNSYLILCHSVSSGTCFGFFVLFKI